MWDYGFETTGARAGDAADWEVSTTCATIRYAVFGDRDWGSERFEDGWGNDAYVWALTDLILEYAEFGTDNDLYEDFEWYPPISVWEDVTDERAIFDALLVPQEDEDFEWTWDNLGYFLTFLSYFIPGEMEPYTIASTTDTFRVRLVRPGFPTFNGTIVVPAGSYTAVALAAVMQGQVSAQLIAAGFGATDIVFYPLTGGLAVVNSKANYVLFLLTGTADGWPSILGRTPDRFDFRYDEDSILDAMDIAWTGMYASSTPHEEGFERGWGNDEPWNYFTFADFIDCDEDVALGITIAAGVNDTFSMRIREWGTVNVSISGVLTVPPGVYTAAGLASAMQVQIDFWMAGAGAPWMIGDILVIPVVHMDGTTRIRIVNHGGTAYTVITCTSQGHLLWDAIGMTYDDGNHVERYLHSASARWRENETLDYAVFNGVDKVENFEVGW